MGSLYEHCRACAGNNAPKVTINCFGGQELTTNGQKLTIHRSGGPELATNTPKVTMNHVWGPITMVICPIIMVILW